ncbi:MAG: hypothetical protein IJP14_02170, partial [Clostridia bacterium]|nr:hypothetical protein [Clostridia bacterium]
CELAEGFRQVPLVDGGELLALRQAFFPARGKGAHHAGDGLADGDLIGWNFYAVVETAEPVPEPFADSALYEVILACGVAVIVLVGIFVYDRVWKKRNG